ncbi:MAG TPA: isochorismatase family cysteine hydrolase [Bacteroidota bacterium]|nr:isochorismatase family cysteine hydrolase [Bacteroidota bacterium]
MNTKPFSALEVRGLARKAYEEGIAQFHVDPDKCALLVIDMQDEFVRPGWTPYWVPAATEIVPRIKTLIETCRSKAIPVIFTAFGRTHGYLDRPHTGESMPNRYHLLGEGDPEWFRDGTIWSTLAPLENEIIIHKPSYGAFYDTPLETILRNMEKDTVIICGTLTNFCCGMTARQAYERGFKVIFGSDVTATDDPDLQEPELKVLRKGFARVMSLEEILGGL